MRFVRCIHVVVPKQSQLGRNPVAFHQRLDFHMINNLSTAVNALLMRMLTSLSADEILLSRYVNWSNNFIGLALKVKKSSCLKNMNYVSFAFS